MGRQSPYSPREAPNPPPDGQQGYPPTPTSSEDSGSLQSKFGAGSEIDYVTLLAIAVIGLIACTSIMYGTNDMAEKIAIGATTGITGFVTRSYLGR